MLLDGLVVDNRDSNSHRHCRNNSSHLLHQEWQLPAPDCLHRLLARKIVNVYLLSL